MLTPADTTNHLTVDCKSRVRTGTILPKGAFDSSRTVFATQALTFVECLTMAVETAGGRTCFSRVFAQSQ